MVPPLAPSPPPITTPRISLDLEEEEESAGLLKSYHSANGEDYPPPPSPPNLGAPFKGGFGGGLRKRPFVAFCLVIALSVLVSATTFLYQQPSRHRTKHADEGIRERMRLAPETELDPTKFRVEGSTVPGDYTVTAIVLHGLGQPNNEPPFVRKLADKFPFVKWVSPTADQLNVTVRGYEPTSAWFNIETFDDLSQGENVEQFVHSQQQLNKLVDDERNEMVHAGKEPRIVLMGFSQGAVMTTLALLTTNETDRYEGGVALSGYVPLLDYLNDIVSPAARGIPMFWGHGKQDPYLTIEQAQSGSKLLRSSRVGLRKLEFNEYEGLDHIWNERELDDVVDWFQRTIPRRKLGRPPFRKPFSASSPNPSITSPPSPSSPLTASQIEEQMIRIKEEETAAENARWKQVELANEEENNSSLSETRLLRKRRDIRTTISTIE